MTPLVLWVPVVALGGFVLWCMADGLVLAQRRARRRFDAVASALGLTPAVEPDGTRRIDLEVGGRTVTVSARHVGNQAQGRGETGWLWVTETRLRVSRWEMHDVGIRQRRRVGDFNRRFVIRESGVPVRDGWLAEPVRQALTAFYNGALAIGTLRVDRGHLQHVASWARAPERPSVSDVRAIVDRLVAVAGSFDEAASRRHPMH